MKMKHAASTTMNLHVLIWLAFCRLSWITVNISYTSKGSVELFRLSAELLKLKVGISHWLPKRHLNFSDPQVKRYTLAGKSAGFLPYCAMENAYLKLVHISLIFKRSNFQFAKLHAGKLGYGSLDWEPDSTSKTSCSVLPEDLAVQ